MTATKPSPVVLQMMTNAILSILNTAGGPGSNETVEFLAEKIDSIQWTRVLWADLSTTERSFLRFTWEFVHRTACPLPLNPEELG